MGELCIVINASVYTECSDASRLIIIVEYSGGPVSLHLKSCFVDLSTLNMMYKLQWGLGRLIMTSVLCVVINLFSSKVC